MDIVSVKEWVKRGDANFFEFRDSGSIWFLDREIEFFEYTFKETIPILIEYYGPFQKATIYLLTKLRFSEIGKLYEISKKGIGKREPVFCVFVEDFEFDNTPKSEGELKSVLTPLHFQVYKWQNDDSPIVSHIQIF